MKKTVVVVSTVVIALLMLTGVGICSSISNIRTSPDSPSALPFGRHVDITFDYSCSEPGGIRIFPRPMTNGEPTAGYGASGSPIYAFGSGSGSGFFTINGDEKIVDHIRFEIYNADQSALLGRFLVPVFFHFSSSPVAVTNIKSASPSPASLAFGQDVDITFDYSSSETGGVRIFPRPITNDHTTPHYAASGSPLYVSGSGSGAGSFTITSGETTVDHIRFEIYNADQSALLGRFFVPVQYAFPVNFISPPSDAPVLTVTKIDGLAYLTWTPSPTATGYLIGYAPFPNMEYVEVLDAGKSTSFPFYLFYGSVAYYVIVVPYNANGLGAPSNVETFVIP